MISQELKSELLSELMDARMQHIRWITEVLKGDSFEAEGDHTQCRFGRWLIDVKGVLNSVEEFERLKLPHQDLHTAYHLLKKNPDHSALRDGLKQLSNTLINHIDALEKRLNQAA